MTNYQKLWAQVADYWRDKALEFDDLLKKLQMTEGITQLRAEVTRLKDLEDENYRLRAALIKKQQKTGENDEKTTCACNCQRNDTPSRNSGNH